MITYPNFSTLSSSPTNSNQEYNFLVRTQIMNERTKSTKQYSKANNHRLTQRNREQEGRNGVLKLKGR